MGFEARAQFLNGAGDEVSRKGHNDKRDDRVDEDPVVDRNGTHALSEIESVIGSGLGAFFNDKEEILEVDASHRKADDRHDDVVDERLGDRNDPASENHTDGDIDDVSLNCKFFEVVEHAPLYSR